VFVGRRVRKKFVVGGSGSKANKHVWAEGAVESVAPDYGVSAESLLRGECAAFEGNDHWYVELIYSKRTPYARPGLPASAH